MDNATKMNALEKVDMMSSHVGYPDELLNETKVNEYYQDLELTGENYLESSLNLTLFATLKKYSLLQLPVDKDDWTFHADVAALVTSYSAIHNALSNYILIEDIFYYISNDIQCIDYYFSVFVQ